MTARLTLRPQFGNYSYPRNPYSPIIRILKLMKHNSAYPHNKAWRESNLSNPLRRKSLLLKILFGLTTLLLVACAGASIAPEDGLSPAPAVAAEAAKPDLVDPAQAFPQQADNLGDGRPVNPVSIPSVENAGENSEADSTPPAVAEIPYGDISSEVPLSEPSSVVVAKETEFEVGPQPLQAPAAVTVDSSPQTFFPVAPTFTLNSASGEPVSLETYRSQSNVVLVFYRGFW